MLPSSFFFHQAAEIGLNPSQFLTYIIRTSISERINSLSYTKTYRKLLQDLDEKILGLKNQVSAKKKIAVILGGYSSERHISVESGRNIFEKLASSTKYEPVPVFLVGSEKEYSLYQIPINLLLKDNADDIRDKILHFKKHPVIEKIKKQCRELTSKYASSSIVFEPEKISLEDLGKTMDGVFIALHGRPGEDGQLQSDLDKFNIPYNGSGVASSQITINKYQTNEILRQHGFKIATHLLLKKEDWQHDKDRFYEGITAAVSYPFICKPVDDGCSSAVKKIHSLDDLDAFCHLIFRDKEELQKKYTHILGLKPKEEFPRKKQLLVEELITRNGAEHFLEITGGMVTKLNGTGKIQFEIFEPSEALAGEDVLSLEEKFLAGQGQNITPARFAKDKKEYERIAAFVKTDFEKAARILNVSGYCRIDAFVRIFADGRVETIIIEVNSLPGMTPATVIFHQAAINHYKPFDFIDKILEFSFQKKQLAASS
jgi:D-alanine-D-alanine ligase